MKAKNVIVMLAIGCVAMPLVWAQRGVGESEGLARQGGQPERVVLTGTLQEVKTGPCEHTTGRAYIGTHLLLLTAAGEEIDLHVGAAEAVAAFVETLEEGQSLEVEAFRTPRHAEGHFVAKVIRVADEEFVVRNENLRPFWAAQRRGGREPAGQMRPRRQDRLHDEGRMRAGQRLRRSEGHESRSPRRSGEDVE